MCDPRQELSNAFNTVTGWVDQALTGVGKTLDAIAKDPLPTIATIALTSVGVPPMVTSLVRTAVTGGNMEDMIIGMATSYIGGQLGAAAGDLAVPELGNVAGYGGFGDVAFQPTATDAILKSVISNASAQGAAAILQGKDLDQVFETALTGAVGGLLNNAIRTEFGLDPSKFEGKLLTDATQAAVGSIFNGKDPGLAIGEALGKSAFGTLTNAAAAGFKSVVKDLNDAATEYDSTYSEANTLQTQINDEYTALAESQSDLESLVGDYQELRGTLLNSQESIDLIKEAFSEASSGDWKKWIQPDSAFNQAIEKSGYVQYGGVNVNTYARPEDLELKASSFYNAKLVPGEIIQFSPGNYAEYLGNYGGSSFRPLSESEVYARSTLKAGAEGVTILPPLPKSVEQFGGVSDEGRSLIAFAQKQAVFIKENVSQLDPTVEGSLANKTQSLLTEFDTAKTNYQNKVTRLEELQTTLTGLNSRIEDLLLERDEYLADLSEGISGLTDAAGEEISGAAKDIAEEAVGLLDANFRTSDEVEQAFANNPLFADYEPSPADIAKFVGEGADADLQGLIDSFVDEHTVDANELADIALKEGLTLTPDELNSLVQQGDESELRKSFQEQFDRQGVTLEEAKEFFGDYKPSARELSLFTGRQNEEATKAKIADYADRRSVDYAEARQALIAAGYEDPPDDLVKQFVGQSEDRVETIPGRRLSAFSSRRSAPTQRLIPADENFESSALSQIQSTYDPQFVTRDEAEQFFDDIGFKPTDEQLLQFMGKRDESTTFQDIEEFVTGQRESDAKRAGFPDYATQQRFDGDLDAYKSTLPNAATLPSSKPAGELAPALPETDVDSFFGIAPITPPFPYTPGEDAEEFTTVVGGAGNDTPLGLSGEDTVKAIEGEEAVVEEISKQPSGTENIVISNEDGATITLDPDGSVLSVTDADGEDVTQDDEVQQIIADVIANPADVSRVEPDEGADTVVGGLLGDEAQAVESGDLGEDITEVALPETISPPYTPGEDAEEFEPPETITPPYTPGEDAEEFETPETIIPPYTPGEDAEEFETPETISPPYTPGEDAEEFVPPAISEEVTEEVDLQAERERLAYESGFPSVELYEQYQGDLAQYQKDQALDAGFPDYATYSRYGGDATMYQMDQFAIAAGFPDFETYEQFEGDYDAYVASLAPPYTPGEDAEEFIPPYTPGEDAEEFVPPYTPGEDAEEVAPPYTPGEDAEEFKPPYTPGEDAEDFTPPYTPGEDAEEFIPPYTPGEDAEEIQPPYTPGEDAEEFIPPYTPGEDAGEFAGEDTQPGFGFEVEGDQTGRGAYTYVDDDGNVLVIEDDGTMYLTDPDGNQVDLGNISTKYPLLKPQPEPKPVTPPPVKPKPETQPPKKPPLQGLPAGLNWEQFLAQQAALGPMFQPFYAGMPSSAQAGANGPRFEAFYANIPGYKPFDIREFSSEFYDQE